MKNSAIFLSIFTLIYVPYVAAIPYQINTHKATLGKYSRSNNKTHIQRRAHTIKSRNTQPKKPTLTLYSLDTDCNNSLNCFIDKIPKTQDKTYSRIGDIMQFIGSNDPSYIRDPCNKILADDTLDNKFLTTYLKRMGWVGYSEDSKPFLQTPNNAQHDYKLAKEIFLEMHNTYASPTPNEIVIYIRASDKVRLINDRTCKQASGIGCQEVIANYKEYILSEVEKSITDNPSANQFTIVSSNWNFHLLKKEDQTRQHKLYSDILNGLLVYGKTIQLHSSTDLDEDLYYMVTSKNFISMNEIGNLSRLAHNIQAA